MIPSAAADAAAAYEQLRHQVRTGSSPGGHVGLVLLLREGVAAWLEHSASGVTPGLGASIAGPRLQHAA